ncbi:hypothetical protein ElyMa_003087900 [Elysia marginata]|uniref:Uncharacterized protein n=1 Tax=Elysia marginata TaxID=1093978 RepID=A0AAV4IPA8_9GAST|nr:hypothetical protein ElyMa_003087900 [Elysia marginata]
MLFMLLTDLTLFVSQGCHGYSHRLEDFVECTVRYSSAIEESTGGADIKVSFAELGDINFRWPSEKDVYTLCPGRVSSPPSWMSVNKQESTKGGVRCQRICGELLDSNEAEAMMKIFRQSAEILDFKPRRKVPQSSALQSANKRGKKFLILRRSDIRQVNETGVYPESKEVPDDDDAVVDSVVDEEEDSVVD